MLALYTVNLFRVYSTTAGNLEFSVNSEFTSFCEVLRKDNKHSGTLLISLLYIKQMIASLLINKPFVSGKAAYRLAASLLRKPLGFTLKSHTLVSMFKKHTCSVILCSALTWVELCQITHCHFAPNCKQMVNVTLKPKAHNAA